MESQHDPEQDVVMGDTNENDAGKGKEAQQTEGEEAGGGGDAGTTSGGAETDGKEEEKEKEMVAPQVSATLLKELMEMGFGENRCVRALHFTDGAGVEAAVQWIVEHGEDVDVDEELLVPRAPPKLTPEEAKQKAEELLRRGKEKREREEKELEKLREKERVRFGKEMAAARKLEEEEEIKRNLKERLRQKKEDAKAKEKIKMKLEEDRIARRLARGLPAEYTEEELEEMRKKKEAEADKAFKSRNESMNRPVIRSVSVAEKLRALLVSIKKTKEADASATAFKTLNTLCGNVGKAPQNEKFRRINLYNPAIKSRCGSIPEAVSFLEICGFNKSSCDEGEFLEIDEAAVDKAKFLAAVTELTAAMQNPFFGVL